MLIKIENGGRSWIAGRTTTQFTNKDQGKTFDAMVNLQHHNKHGRVDEKVPRTLLVYSVSKDTYTGEPVVNTRFAQSNND